MRLPQLYQQDREQAVQEGFQIGFQIGRQLCIPFSQKRRLNGT